MEPDTSESPMSLLDVYESLEAVPVRSCKICDWVKRQTAEDKDFFDRMCVGNKVRLLEACKAFGLDAEITTLRRHVRESHVS